MFIMQSLNLSGTLSVQYAIVPWASSGVEIMKKEHITISRENLRLYVPVVPYDEVPLIVSECTWIPPDDAFAIRDTPISFWETETVNSPYYD